jgi:ABC-2 type transport system ATP-binding protein
VQNLTPDQRGVDALSVKRHQAVSLGGDSAKNAARTYLLLADDMSDIERLCERVLVVDRGRLAFDGTLAGLAARVALQRVLVVDLPEPGPDLHVAAAIHIGSELGGQRQRLAFSPQQTTAARVLAEVTAKTEVIDLTLEEPAIEDIVRTLYGGP